MTNKRILLLGGQEVIADAIGWIITVLTDQKTAWVHHVYPRKLQSGEEIFLGLWGGEHYIFQE